MDYPVQRSYHGISVDDVSLINSRTCKTFPELLTKLLHCVVSNLHGCHNLYCMHQNLPQIFAETISPTVYYEFLTYFRRDHVADELWVFGKQSPKHYFGFWIFNMLVKTPWTLVLTTLDNIGYPTSFSRSTSCGSFINLTI